MPEPLLDAESRARQLSARGARRGHDASSPVSMPWRGWRDILRRVTGQVETDRVPLVAAGVTYYLLLSLVPALTALVSVYGLFSDPSAVQQQLALLRPFLPADALTILEVELLRLATQTDSALGLAAALAVGIALWRANSGMKAVIQALNIAYDESEKRGYRRLTAISLAFTPGAGIAVLICVLASLAFSWCVASFESFNKTYGSLGAIIMLMTWVWILITVVIMGAGFNAEFNAETERQTLRDSTKGPNRPLGQRGAVVADDVASVHRPG